MTDVRRVAGTSAGAIAALTVALGYNSSEIASIISETKPQKFNDGQFFFIGGMIRMNRHYGWYRGKTFTRWIGEVIKNKTGDADITFKQLHEKGFRDLHITGTSLNRQELIVFSRNNYPDMKVKDAVRVSISIPYYFVAVPIDSSGNILSRRSNHATDIMVDGGFTGNFPIAIFDSISFENNIKNRAANAHTLGFRIDNPDQIKRDTITQSLAPVNIDGLKNYTQAFYNYIIENLNRTGLTLADWERTVSISSGNIGPKIRRLNDEEKNTLIRNGRDATHAFLRKRLVVQD
jgi:NTE family protein